MKRNKGVLPWEKKVASIFSVFSSSLSGDVALWNPEDESFSPLWRWKLLVKIDFNSVLEAAGDTRKAYA